MNPLPAIESATAAEAAPEATAAEWAAWAVRRSLPSELVHKVALRWPADAAEMTGIPESTLRAMRSAGDYPRLFAIGRALFTTSQALAEWLEAHALAHGQCVRPPTVPRGTRLRTAGGAR